MPLCLVSLHFPDTVRRNLFFSYISSCPVRQASFQIWVSFLEKGIFLVQCARRCRWQGEKFPFSPVTVSTVDEDLSRSLEYHCVEPARLTLGLGLL